jgi:hypothetical protein
VDPSYVAESVTKEDVGQSRGKAMYFILGTQ